MGHVTKRQNQGSFSFGGVKWAGDIWADKKGADSWYGASRMRSASTFSSAFPFWRTFFKLGLKIWIRSFFCWRYGGKTSGICQSDYNSLASSRAIINADWISSLSINMPSASTNLIYFPKYIKSQSKHGLTSVDFDDEAFLSLHSSSRWCHDKPSH